MKAMQAEKNDATTTPASNRTRTSIACPVAVATRNTSTIARSAPAKAAKGRLHDPSPAQPKASTVTAPTDAPPEMPRMYGSANGLRNSAWKVAPASASDAAFAYQLTRANDPTRLFRVEFDASDPVSPPPPAWGW